VKISSSQSPRPPEPEDHHPQPPRQRHLTFYDFDQAAQVRAAREAAQCEMEAFGDPSEYDTYKIYGQRTDITYEDVETSESSKPTEDTPAEQPSSDKES